MKEDDLNIFIPEEKFLQIGKKRFKIWNSTRRSCEATELYNKLNIKGTEERKSIKTDYDMYSAWIDICLLLIKQEFIVMMKKSFSIKTMFDWIKRERLTKKYLMDYMDVKELTEFVEKALDPIIGTKKKVMEREQKATDAMLILMETITPEALAKLLQNLLQPVDTKKVM